MAGTLPGRFTMSELVERTGVPAATVRYYLSSGLLPPPAKLATNRFLYDERHVELVRLVRLLRERRHLTLDSIAGLLPALLPDLLEQPPVGGVFRPDMWGRLLSFSPEPTLAELAGERVLHAAVAAFARNGYSEVTVDDVCRAAGIAKGSFYRHFASKEDLFLAAALAAGEAAAARLSSAVAGLLVAEAAEPVLAEALAPELGILLDLAALASRQRPGAAEVLAKVDDRLREALGPVDPGGDDASGRRVAYALGAAIRGLARMAGPDSSGVLSASSGVR